MKTEKIVRELKNKFEDQLNTFPLNVSHHYAERLYRITGDKKYINPIKTYLFSKQEEILYLINIANDKEKQQIWGNKLIEELMSGKWNAEKRFIKRYNEYKKIPEFKYYYELTWYLNKLNDYKIKNFDIVKITKSIKDIDYLAFFKKTDILQVDPVQTINFVFNMKNIGLPDITKQTIDIVNKIYSNPVDTESLLQKVYFLTHVLISESRYYQHFIDSADYQWIYDFFDSNIEKILALPTDDIIAEVGVCYKIAKNTNNSFKSIQNYILQKLALNDGLLLYKDPINEKKFIYKVEHRNVLAIILLSNIDSLYEGPIINLS